MKSKTKPETQPVPESAVVAEPAAVATEESKAKRRRAKQPTLQLVKDAEREPEPTPKRTRRAQTAPVADSATTAAEPSIEPPVDPAQPKRRRVAKANAMTLAQLAERFLARLEADGRSDATQSAYKADLGVAIRVLGAETAIDAVRPEHVAAFNASEAVLLTRAGTPKAAPSYLRTQRVLRLAFDFAEAEAWIVTTPCVAPEA